MEEIKDLEDEIQTELKNVKVARATITYTVEIEKKYKEELDKKFKEIVRENIKFNTYCQVDECLEKFRPEVESGHLIIAGALYDFQGKEKQGKGKLIWLDARDSENASKFKDVKSVVRYVNGVNVPDEETTPSGFDQDTYNADQQIYTFSSEEVEENVKNGLKRLEDRIKDGIKIIEEEEKIALVEMKQNKR